MRKRRNSVLALLGGTLLWAGCRDTAPKPDPCRAQLANPLTFQFLEATGTPTPDTTFSQQDVSFVGPGAPYTSYEWQVGTDKRTFTTRQFGLYFYGNENGPVPVRLIARRPPNTACFKNDDGVDTLTKVLTLVSRQAFRSRAPVYGSFEGSTTNAPGQKFTVRVFHGPDPFPPFGGMDYDFLRNLSQGCQSPYFTVALTWRGIAFNYGRNDFNCRTEVGKGYLTTRDSIRIEYSQQAAASGFERVDRVFLGRRVR